jgi:hypothetical protein
MVYPLGIQLVETGPSLRDKDLWSDRYEVAPRWGGVRQRRTPLRHVAEVAQI